MKLSEVFADAWSDHGGGLSNSSVRWLSPGLNSLSALIANTRHAATEHVRMLADILTRSTAAVNADTEQHPGVEYETPLNLDEVRRINRLYNEIARLTEQNENLERQLSDWRLAWEGACLARDEWQRKYYSLVDPRTARG